jgi:diaminopimelate epimerase
MSFTAFFSAPVPQSLQAQRPFIKMQGLRNYFVFIDERRSDGHVPASEIIRICDVHEGVGAEQVVTIETPSIEALALGAYARMRIFNIDGREAGACGNATRCLAYLLFDESGRSEIVLETLGGLLVCRSEGGSNVSVTLGPIKMDWNVIPLSENCDTAHLPIESGPLRDGLALNIGNTHAVFFVDDFDAIDIPAYAPAIQNNSLFPEGANVGVAEKIDERTLKLAVWERPGMLTEACGTGACVAAYAARLRGLITEDKVTVHLPGGSLVIKLLEGGRAEMTGPVAFCCFGYV